jgi:threonine synthase
MGIHGATIFRGQAPDYAGMKKQILDMAADRNLRIVSGNNPIRVEGYKLIAFEMYEQMNGSVPDFIAVPTSACGHVRGIFKGYRELKEAGYIDKLPRMIVVQAANNSPVVTALKQGKQEVVPFTDFQTVAEAITTGNPMGGKEIIDKANRYGWLAEDVSEDQILHSQRRLAQSGLFVEPASATSLYAVKKLKASGKIKDSASVVIMLTGAGMKDLEALSHHKSNIVDCNLENLREEIKKT